MAELDTVKGIDFSPKVLTFAPSPNLIGATDGQRGDMGLGKTRMARSKSERVLYETRQKMHAIRDTLEGHGPGGFPEVGELVRLTTFANINALTILLRAVEVFGTVDLVFASYSINKRAVMAIRQLLADGGIGKATILGSSTITWRDPQRIQEMYETANLFPSRVRFVMAHNHAKVMCFNGVIDSVGHWIVCTGSANLASNSRIEDYVMVNSQPAYLYYLEWIEDVMEPISTGYAP